MNAHSFQGFCQLVPKSSEKSMELQELSNNLTAELWVSGCIGYWHSTRCPLLSLVLFLLTVAAAADSPFETSISLSHSLSKYKRMYEYVVVSEWQNRVKMLKTFELVLAVFHVALLVVFVSRKHKSEIELKKHIVFYLRLLGSSIFL